MSIKRAIAIGLIVCGTLVTPLIVASPASAATSTCKNFAYDQQNGGLNVECKGTTSVKVWVQCNAVWPFTSWKKYSSAFVPGSVGADYLFSSSVFPSCPSPASYSTGYIQA
jgi:hypothetical protein